MSGVGDFRYYNEYDLWDGHRGDLESTGSREEHIRKVFDIQDQLQVPHLAPTILLHTGLSNTSQVALEMAREAKSRDAKCWLSIAGTSPFWASQDPLDAHIGALAELEPAGWFLTVVRPFSLIPVEADPEETHGLCRTVRALSEYGRVHISHGDLAALPAVAAGASSVGSGWDKRQRVCSYADYSPRGEGATGGGWYERATFRGLLGSLSTGEAARLENRNAALAASLGGIPAPGPKEAFLHHLSAIGNIIDDLSVLTAFEEKYRRLVDLYERATGEWPTVSSQANSDYAAKEWIAPLLDGLRLYGKTEGW
jgi:hypothetical protein